jgi:hypothetical protein
LGVQPRRAKVNDAAMPTTTHPTTAIFIRLERA